MLKSIFKLLLGKRLPSTSGTMTVSGVNNEVTIRRDNYGVAYIDANNDDDAWFGLGFSQGQDRAFQIEQTMRVLRGTLSELIGPDGLPFDRLSRRMGLHRISEEQIKVLQDDTRQQLEAFARGVTQGMRMGGKKLAHEFTLMKLKEPSEMTAVDVLSRLRIMGFGLPANWDSELVRMKILKEDGEEALRDLDPVYPDWLPVTKDPLGNAGPAADRLTEDLAVFQSAIGATGGGSNNWAVAPARTSTGRPLLANDPHLPPFLPAHWYLAHVRTPDWAVAGPSFVGSPLFASGHNGFCAWGVTGGFADNTDLFVEEVGHDGKSVREGQDFIPCDVAEEVIKVKGKESVVENVLITKRGPIIGPALDGEVGAISMSATWLQPRPIDGWFKLHKAKSFEQFRKLFASLPALTLNVAYADIHGDIGWQFAGDIPKRRKGWGLMPGNGGDPEAGWEDEPVSFDSLPYSQNPDIGFVASANNQPTVSSENEPFLGLDWLDGYRFARISEKLASRSDWDVEGMLNLQKDQKSIPWREMKEVLLTASVDSPESKQALSILKEWDGVVSASSPGATVFELFVSEMISRIVKAKAPNTAEWALGKEFHLLVPFTNLPQQRVGQLVKLIKESPSGWFERSWPEEIGDALGQAVKRLEGKLGEDSAKWAWGKFRPLTLAHPVGEKKPMDKVFNIGPFPWGGDQNTVAQAATPLLDPEGNPYYNPSLRMVIDVGNWDECTFAMPGGQSGNPFSPHYGDQVDAYRDGEPVPIAWSAEEVQRETKATLTLKAAE